MALSLLRIDVVRDRIADQVPEIEDLGSAGQFSDLIERRQLPPWRLGAFVLPGRLAGGGAQAMAGAFVQGLVETVSVVLVVRVAGDPTGEKAFDEITPIARKVVGAVCGWGPNDSPGIFTLASGELIGGEKGALVYQLDFALEDQLRIMA